jgi:hypothetical protein
MPKYKVTLSMSCEKVSQLILEADDPDQLHDIIGEMDSSFIEENLEWRIVDMDYPEIEEFERVSKTEPSHPAIQKEANNIVKAWEAL